MFCGTFCPLTIRLNPGAALRPSRTRSQGQEAIEDAGGQAARQNQRLRLDCIEVLRAELADRSRLACRVVVEHDPVASGEQIGFLFGQCGLLSQAQAQIIERHSDGALVRSEIGQRLKRRARRWSCD